MVLTTFIWLLYIAQGQKSLNSRFVYHFETVRSMADLKYKSYLHSVDVLYIDL